MRTTSQDSDVLLAGLDVAEKLRTAEAAIDQALIATAALNGTMPQVRIDAALAAECGHKAMEQASESQQLLMQARTRMVAAHRMLAKTRDGLGLDAHAFGDLYGKPKISEEPASLLKVVGGSQA